jgi:hypothetical protein
MMTDAYAAFLQSKMPSAIPMGFARDELHHALKPFQRDIVSWALRMGRGAIFAGTGLGKTLMELVWSQEVARETRRPVLSLAPLAVAQQTVREASKFGIPLVAYATDHAAIAGATLPISNYDRLDRFDFREFGGIVLDESSIIKSHDSATRAALIELCAGIPYRLPATATPAPNDYVELGNHAEFLGVCSAKEMLATWFVHDGSIRATNADNHGSKPVAEWRLKGHAQNDFWKWVASWSVMIRHPRELRYEEPGYDLPPLNKIQITVPADYEPDIDTGMLFPIEARTLKERLGARRSSISRRVAAACELINDQSDRPWLAWCNLNDESSALARGIGNAIEVRGSDAVDAKADRMLRLAAGERVTLVTKPSIAGWGLNFQACGDMVFVGLNDSFEQLFQAIRRCWRFGRTEPVNVYMVASELEGAVVANLEAKERDYEAMASAMAEHMRDLSIRSLRGAEVKQILPHSKQMSVPTWLTAA